MWRHLYAQGTQLKKSILDFQALKQQCIKNRHVSVMEITAWALKNTSRNLFLWAQFTGIMHKCELKLYHAKKKPNVNMIQKHSHLFWAKTNLKWSEAEWSTVLWSDKTKFEILLGNHAHYILWTKEERDRPICYQCSFKSLHLWYWVH